MKMIAGLLDVGAGEGLTDLCSCHDASCGRACGCRPDVTAVPDVVTTNLDAWKVSVMFNEAR